MPHPNDWEKEFDEKYPETDWYGSPVIGIKDFIRSLLLSQKQGLAKKVIGLQKDRYGIGDTHHWWVKYDEVIALLQEPSSGTGL